ncbi:major facilitator superfamily domain-containing protein [Mycena rosella]|uniref:Major facilitator superfamily domain-containing protein n=1 Tax=Mycena rosella TaxID=1033263 RepID=A0AAD7DSB7_MYCRO|nr:major facilitator superfamily domain-containing protein [Mycena rosella]
MAPPRVSSRLRAGRSSSTISGHNAMSNEDSDELAPGSASPQENPVVEESAAKEMYWWKRPGPWWLMVLSLLSTTILAATVAPQIELFTTLACRARHRPGFRRESFTVINASLLSYSLPNSPPSFNIVLNDGVEHVTLKSVFVEATDPDPCASDPAIQATVATLMTAISTLSGILTLATVGWWGSFSDRHGRKKMLGITAVGQLIAAVNIIFVTKILQGIPGGYWLLVFDGVIVGSVGGVLGEISVMQAYIADVSTPENRSRIFSAFAGSMLVGVGVGPMLGSILVRYTHNLLSVFYLAAAFRIIHTCFIWFILPESLTAAQMERASVKHQENSIIDDPSPLLWFKRIFFFLMPLSALFPDKISDANHLRGARRDWNLPILVLASGMITLASSSLLIQLLYARYAFGWGAEYLGYCLSSIGVTRAIYLMLILPFAIKFAKKWWQNESSPRSFESEPLLSDQDSTSRPAKPKAHISVFDLGLARFSVLVDVATSAALPFAPTGNIFVLFIMLGSPGAGLGPAVSSLALEIYSRRFGKNEPVESGKLFGAMTVASCVFAQILGPPMYGLIYSATVATFPRTIFFVALGSSVVGFALLSCVRLRPDSGNVEHPADFPVQLGNA